MNAADLYPSLSLFKAIVGLEDDISVDSPAPEKSDNPETKRQKAAAFFGKVKQAAAEKKALIKRTHNATLVILTDYNAKPYTFAVGKTWDLIFPEPAKNEKPSFTQFSVVTATTDPNDPGVSRPEAMYVIPCEHVLEIQIRDAEQSFMAAASNALAEHSSASAKRIVELVGMEQIVEQAKLEQAKNQATSTPGQMQILWYPVYGWADPGMTLADGSNLDSFTSYPLQAVGPQVASNSNSSGK